jgi:hypothetical protein
MAAGKNEYVTTPTDRTSGGSISETTTHVTATPKLP